MNSDRQSGAAAVEFALVFPVVFLLLYGLISFGAILYTQLAVSRAVEDGARAANTLDQCTLDPDCDFPSLVRAEVIESLVNSAVVPVPFGQNEQSRRNWLITQVESRIDISGPAPCALGDGTCTSIVLRFPYTEQSGTRLFPAIDIPGIGGTGTWLPEQIVSSAVVRL